ncbi:NADH:ubiquinone oxidoreductase complex I intermediate-associated protein 30 [Hyaloscypha variabilis F]|uniref:NADH:ubiquinone oxidoreductase complex I intermediate-associated protein 30 n=1 Tax=Hyaloscypha variabilis (strain UAMH 11265 / GT02V1 / F) TaxID=1149755 RepID=A0A2J6SBX9_HYAVF|nr:NADH:ubiquinone oxidoreductase complex I intermediate-associated protein 30 [Hyaloscypha variabilis F]
MTSLLTQIFLFGGDRKWSPNDWTDSDDRVRGGSSYSELTCDPSSPTAIFHGNLDTKTLGGAGFASQRTTGEDRDWDLSNYDGITLDIKKSDDKKYTLILKDELLPKSPNGREQSTVSWEYDFEGYDDGGKVFVHWDEFKATYRGREKKDAKPLDLKHVRRISLMMRSFFDTQEGDFSLSITSISAFKKGEMRTDEPSSNAPKHDSQGWLSRFFRQCLP